MSQPMVTLLIFPTPDSGLAVQLNQKQDSQMLSVFQAVGMSYQVLDAMIERDNRLADFAKEYFVKNLIADGWEKYIATQLVMEKCWQRRMHGIWYPMTGEEKTSAVAIDYEIYQNYWPNLDFMEPGFGADV
jgi:hypothetical protein